MRLRELFIEAVQKKTAAEREAFLVAECGDDAELRRCVDQLVVEHERQGTFLLDKAPPGVGTWFTAGAASPGTQIGVYTLREQVAEGGMGVVFRAEQSEPVARQVALKIIKPGMDTQQVLARFEAERQALALMDHPNIARVLDAGATASGHPYFVMEYVDGQPIANYCDDKRLDIRQRMELMIPVCQAIQHAHQKGIIHRDIKPSNILVAEYDGRPVPKVIDFGVSKAIAQRLSEQSVFTLHGQIIGTLEYMSPEQAGLSQQDVDTRSDVYSLGVLLYELLTGSTPFDKEKLREASFDEMRRIICEDDPPRPSQRISTRNAQAGSTVSTHRGLDERQLHRALRGELDWIVLKALEKDRNGRFESASVLAADLERYLDGELVHACPPSAAYRFRKFAKKHKPFLATGSIVAAALLVGTVLSTWQAIRATRAEAAARANEAIALQAGAAERSIKEQALLAAAAEKQAKQQALKSEDETNAALDFVENKVFAAARPEGQEGGLGHDVTLRQAVQAALPFVERSFADKPLIEARLRMTLGRTFRDLGEAQIALEQYTAAYKLFTDHAGAGHPDTLKCMSGLAICYTTLGRDSEALPLFDQALAQRKAQLGVDHSLTLSAMNNLALCYRTLGRPQEAVKVYEEALALQKAKLGADHPDTLSAMANLAGSYGAQRAVKLHEEVLALRKVKLGADHPDTLSTMSSLADCYGNLGRSQDAVKLHEETLALRKGRLGAAHAGTLGTMTNLANMYVRLGRLNEAVKLEEEALSLKKGKLGADHPDTIGSMQNLATSYSMLGRNDEARQLFEQTLELQKAKLGADHPRTLYSMDNLASYHTSRGSHEKALELYERTRALQITRLGADHPHTLWVLFRLAVCLEKLDRSGEAIPLIDECVRLSTGKDLHPAVVGGVMGVRLRHFESLYDPAGCRETAELLEGLKRIDSASLYQAAQMRATTARVLLAADFSSDAAAKAKAEAERAMAWLQKAVAAGFQNASRLASDQSLETLRSRDDFQKLQAELQAISKAKRPPAQGAKTPVPGRG